MELSALPEEKKYFSLPFQDFSVFQKNDFKAKLTNIETLFGPYQSKEMADLWIGKLKNSFDLNLHFFQSLEKSYRDIYGHGKPVDDVSWGEYLKCLQCGKNLSIEAVYQNTRYVLLDFLEREGLAFTPFCCEQRMEFFYEPEKLALKMQQQFTRKKIAAVFLYNQENEIFGFAYGWLDTIEKIWEEFFSNFYQHTRLNYNSYLKQLEQKTEGELLSQSQIFYLAELGVSLPARKMEITFKLIESLLKIALENLKYANIQADKISVIASSMPHSNSYKLFRGAGCRELCQTDDFELVVLGGKLEALLKEFSLPPKDFFRKNLGKIKKIISKNKNI